MCVCVQVEVAEKLVVRVWKKVLAHPGKPCSFLKPWLTQLPDLKKKNGKKKKKKNSATLWEKKQTAGK